MKLNEVLSELFSKIQHTNWTPTQSHNKFGEEPNSLKGKKTHFYLKQKITVEAMYLKVSKFRAQISLLYQNMAVLVMFLVLYLPREENTKISSTL